MASHAGCSMLICDHFEQLIFASATHWKYHHLGQSILTLIITTNDDEMSVGNVVLLTYCWLGKSRPSNIVGELSLGEDEINFHYITLNLKCQCLVELASSQVSAAAAAAIGRSLVSSGIQP